MRVGSAGHTWVAEVAQGATRGWGGVARGATCGCGGVVRGVPHMGEEG